jgi:dihydroxy-acid dehydratase
MHLIAMAHSVDIEITLDDFQAISDKTPVLADLKPSGKFMMEDLHAVGGIPALMKYLLKEGFIHGDCMTVTGKTIAENLESVPDLYEGQVVVQEVKNALKSSGNIQILYGNLASEGCVAKISGKEGEYFEGTAVVFESEFEVIPGLEKGMIKPGDVVVIRYCGPKGGPGMPEMLKPTSAIMGAGLGDKVALITDGRFSGGSHGFVVGHITPEAYDGGGIALIEDGDVIAIDAVKNTITLKIPDAEYAERLANWVQPDLKVTKGVLLKYARAVSSASTGCVTDK